MIVRNFKEKLHEVRAFAFDVDGVCTNNQVILSESGDLLRSANTRDGYAISIAARHGYPIAIITGGRSESVRSRFLALGVQHVYLGCTDKAEALEEFCALHDIAPSQVLYMGDDMPDLPVLQRVGFPTCPADATAEVQAASIYISRFGGGYGCVRDVVEQVLKLAGKWGTAETANQ